MKKNEHYNRNKCNEENTIWLEENLHEKDRTVSQNLSRAIFNLTPVTISFLDTFWTKYKAAKFGGMS